MTDRRAAQINADAVIFDMDGLLVDTEACWARAEREVFESLGVTLNEADCRLTAAMTTSAVVEFWFARSPWESMSKGAAEEAVIERVAHLMGDACQLMPGALSALNMVRAFQLPVAVATNSPRRLAERALTGSGIRHYPEQLVTVDDVPAGKPAPDLYLLAAERLGVAAQHCIALEDSPRGAEAALRAGMRVVAVQADIRREARAFRGASLLLESLEDLSPELFGSLRDDC